MKAYRTVLAVDRYDLLATGRSIVNRHRNLILAGEAAISIELLTLLDAMPADVVILSMSLPSIKKREVIRTVARRFPHLKILHLQKRCTLALPRYFGINNTRPKVTIPKGATITGTGHG